MTYTYETDKWTRISSLQTSCVNKLDTAQRCQHPHVTLFCCGTRCFVQARAWPASLSLTAAPSIARDVHHADPSTSHPALRPLARLSARSPRSPQAFAASAAPRMFAEKTFTLTCARIAPCDRLKCRLPPNTERAYWLSLAGKSQVSTKNPSCERSAQRAFR